MDTVCVHVCMGTTLSMRGDTEQPSGSLGPPQRPCRWNSGTQAALPGEPSHILFYVETGSMWPWLSWNLLYRPG